MPQITGQLCNYFRVRLFANTAGVVKMTAKSAIALTLTGYNYRVHKRKTAPENGRCGIVYWLILAAWKP